MEQKPCPEQGGEPGQLISHAVPVYPRSQVQIESGRGGGIVVVVVVVVVALGDVSFADDEFVVPLIEVVVENMPGGERGIGSLQDP